MTIKSEYNLKSKIGNPASNNHTIIFKKVTDSDFFFLNLSSKNKLNSPLCASILKPYKNITKGNTDTKR